MKFGFGFCHATVAVVRSEVVGRVVGGAEGRNFLSVRFLA